MPPDSARAADSTRRARLLQAAADTDTTSRDNILGIPGIDGLPIELNLRTEAKGERDRNLSCNTVENAQVNVLTGCHGGFIPAFDAKASLRAKGSIGRVNIDIDYDMQREFDASNSFSLSYQGRPGEHLQRVDLGNITFTAPPSRFLTPTLPAGNYGVQAVTQFGRLQLRSIFARQTGSIVQDREFVMGGGGSAAQPTEREVEDRQIEPRRFFFTIDPALFGSTYPNIDILNRAQLRALRAALPDTLRPARVLVYRLQFGAQPQNPDGPRFRIQGDTGGGPQTYDLLREGVDYYLDPSQLWFALVRPLVESNERLVVAYNVRVNGRDTVWTTTGGTPDERFEPGHTQIANLVWEPNLNPDSPAFRYEIRSVYRIAGEDLVRSSVQVQVVTGSGQLEHPLAGTDATFLRMFGLARPSNPAEFDAENRIWPRPGEAFSTGIGAVDVRAGASLGLAHVIRDQFLVFPSLRPFAERDASSGGGLVTPGNPANEAIYTTPGEYLYSPQRPASVYRLRLQYTTAGTDEPGSLTLGATQMRPGSEQVVVDKRTLVRDLDYHIDYDLGRIDFMRPDTLFDRERRVEVRYEETPGFAPALTTLAGLVSELPVPHGVLDFTAINQSQGTAATRPQLGFQSASSLTTGVSARFDWAAPALTRLASRLPSGKTDVESHIRLRGEIATSHPQFGAGGSGEAFVDGFDGAGGTSIPLADIAWAYSSLPAYGSALGTFGPSFFEPDHAATLTWQTNARSVTGGGPIVFKQSQIDPLTALVGSGFEPNEPVLWLSLLPARQAGRYNPVTREYDWTVPSAQPGRRFRSIRTVLSPAGVDLSHGEFLEFWTLLDTTDAGRASNPTLIFDFGDISENALSFAPETLTIRPAMTGSGGVDSVFTGRRLQGVDRLDTERDPFSHAFNYQVNDTGLPGDVDDTLVVIDGAAVRREANVHVCRGTLGALEVLGDPRANCTFGNFRLDEEDIDLDNALNFRAAQRENERVLRYVVDLSARDVYKRLGGTYTDSVFVNGVPRARTRRWALISIPFTEPTDSLNAVNRRRLRALRLTVVSGLGQSDDEPVQFPLAGLRVTGAPWLNRSNAGLAGIAGAQPAGGFVVTSTIGTNDSSATLVYQPPPGVVDEADVRGAQFGSMRIPINERSMRIQAGGLAPLQRAEAYFRFPSGPQYYQGFRRLRVWGRGRGSGWGPGGDLQMFVKVGRDEHNFYLYHAPMNAGATPAAWTDLAIDFSRFVTLRQKIQVAYLTGANESIACTGADSAMIAASPLPVGVQAHRFAACDGDGYMVYTVDPAVAAPNLAAVQELAVGFIRLGASGGASAILPGDTLELWVDDVRLDRPVSATGVASQFSLGLNAADFGDLHIDVGNRDPHFRQLGEQPTFLSERSVDVLGTVNLDRLLPAGAGLALPLTINKVSLANDPLYLTGTDIPGAGIPGLRRPRSDVTTYSLSVRRRAPAGPESGILDALAGGLSGTASYVRGENRSEYQEASTRALDLAVDYAVTGDSTHALLLPVWLAGALGDRDGTFQLSPAQFRVTTGFFRSSEQRRSFLQPASAAGDLPGASDALDERWRGGGVLELQPTDGLMARWELRSVRDLRDYDGGTVAGAAALRARGRLLGTDVGLERERSLLTNISWRPAVGDWLRPRAELAAQYAMLRDPDARWLVPLPGVVGVDSVLAAHDSLALAASFTLPRRLTAAQTASLDASIDLARAAGGAGGSLLGAVARRFTPIDISYTRSLLTALDAAPVDAPLALQLGFAGPGDYRTVNGVTATTAGQTRVLSAGGSLLLPFGASLANRFTRTATANWIDRLDGSPARVDGSQRQFPDVSLRWGYRPAPGAWVSRLDAGAGYVRSDARMSLPSLASQAPAELRHTSIETVPLSGSVAWAGRGRLSTAVRFNLSRRIDSLPGSIARTRGTELTIDAGRVFFIPRSWQLGIHDDLRTHVTYQETRNTTSVFDAEGAMRARLQDNGRRALTFTADSNINEFVVLTLNGSHIVTFDDNLNRRFSYTVFSTVFQIHFFGGGQ